MSSPPQGPASDRQFAIRLALFYGALFLVAGTKLPYLPVWLQSRGLTAAEIALVTSAPLFLRIVATPTIAVGADLYGNRRRVIIGLAWVALAAFLCLVASAGFWPILLVTLVLALATTSIMPLTETVAMAGVRRAGLDYGRMRLWGSLTFILASFVAGFAIDLWGASSIGLLLVIGAAATVAVAHALPWDTVSGAAPPVRRITLADAASIATNRSFLLFLVAAGAVQAAHAVFYTFGVIEWRAQGLNSGWAGVLWAIGVVTEIGLFAFSRSVITRFGARLLLLVAAVAAVARWAAMAFDPPLALLIPLQALHGLTFGAAHLGAVHYISETVPAEQAGTAQALYASVTAGIAMGLATLAAGPLYEMYRGRAYLAMAALALVGLAASALLWRCGAGRHPDP